VRFISPPFKSWRPAPVSRTGPQRQLGVGVGARVRGPRTPSTALQVGLRGHRAPSVPTHPLIPSLEGRGDFNATNFRFAALAHRAFHPRFTTAVGFERRFELAENRSREIRQRDSSRYAFSTGSKAARNQRFRSKARPSKPSASPRPPSRGPASSSLAREAETGCAADRRVIIPRHGQRSAGPRLEAGVTMRWRQAFAVKPSLARGWG